MEEFGVVKETVGPKAVVLIRRQGACEGCPAGSLCKSAGDHAEIEALNEARARAGDMVRLSFKPYTYLKGTALVYGLPALLLIAGAVIGKEYVSRIFPHSDPDMVSAACGFGLFAISFLTVKLITGRREGKSESMPVISEIIEASGRR